MSKFKGTMSGIFIGMKKASGEVEDVTKDFRVYSWGCLVRFKKIFEGVNILTGQRGVGWALNWFLETQGKELFNLHKFEILSGCTGEDKWCVTIMAEYYLTGLTKEEDVDAWAKDRVKNYCEKPVLCGGYQYYARTSSWDEAEIIGEVDIS